jgi:chemotaxis protein CheD
MTAMIITAPAPAHALRAHIGPLRAALAPARPADQEAMLHVWTGQIEVGRGDTVLTALLGSCIGIGMIWRGRGLSALAHCLLPEGGAVEHHAARYVSGAVPALLAALGVRRAQYDEVEVVIAGGARMLRLASGGDGDGAIGRRNISATQKHLAARGLRVGFEDVGGCHGRRMSIDCARQTVSVVRVAGEIGGRA